MLGSQVDPADVTFMARAISLAEKGLYTTSPNPRVGCVLVQQGKIIAEGWHEKAGQAHAEVAAINAAKLAGEDTAGATVYVSLEPCSFQGKTGPCSDALIAAKVSRVVYGMQDPNPKVAGRGIARLREAGIEVFGPVLEDAARSLNPGFIKRMESGLPYVRIKIAMSVDGRTAMASGESQWITGQPARQDVQRLRARSCAVVSGVETVMRDNAKLNVRAEELMIPNATAAAEHQPLRVVLDSQARLPLTATLFAQPGDVLWVTGSDAVIKNSSTEVAAQYEQIKLAKGRERIDLIALINVLGQRECNEVLIESGAILAGQFIQLGLVDELIIYMAPTLMGSNARPLFDMPFELMSDQLSLQIKDIRAVGKDWRITATFTAKG